MHSEDLIESGQVHGSLSVRDVAAVVCRHKLLICLAFPTVAVDAAIVTFFDAESV